MNKFIVSVGLVTAGVTAFHTSAVGQSSILGSPKIWNVSASLDGFYDDNYATAANKKGSFGLEFSPSVNASIPLTQTEIGVMYTYGLQYYQERDQLGQNAVDQDHQFNFWLDHSFNERWNVKLNENFVAGQEPELLNANGAAGTPAGGSPYRLNGDNIANNATIVLHTDWTRLFSTELTYGNGFYDYSQSGSRNFEDPTSDFVYVTTDGGALQGQPSYAGSLDRVQNNVNLDLQWHLSPQTIFTVGYEFLIVNYTGDEVIGYDNVPTGGNPITGYTFNGAGLVVPGINPKAYYSDTRDNLSHIGYVGLQENLLESLTASLKVGGQYNEAINNPQQGDSVTPWANVSLVYTYLPGCNAQVGFSQSRNATDVASVNPLTGSLTQDQESSTLYASINHRLTQKLLVSVIGQWMNSTFQGGEQANQTDTDYNLGLSANYAFTRHFSGNVAYNYDYLTSAIYDRGYERNRISIGVSVAY